jgi:glycosyltransferase involved in cell wall biosynthesis
MILSVIIPVHNGGADFRLCLQALAASTRTPDELIVVDDSSSDASAATARGYGAQVLCLAQGPVGPAAARNYGATAAVGEILVFIDADVTVHTDTLQLIETYLAGQPGVAALFGSYDAAPPKPGLISRYKNLQHYHTHQHGRRESSTFWAGCGAIRRSAFLAVAGFSEAYARPSIEDIELGVRLCGAGYHIWLCPDVQVAHQKQWTLRSWLRADIRDRAVPWTRLILSGAHLPTDMGFGAKSRVSAIAAWALMTCLVLGLWHPPIWWAASFMIGLLFTLNYNLYRLFARQEGLGFALGAFWLHTVFYLYSSLVYGSLVIWHGLRRAGQGIAAAYKVVMLSEEVTHDG